MRKKFLRTQAKRYSKLGKNRKKLQTWRRPKGRHSKQRARKKGHAKNPCIGLKKPAAQSTPVLIHNIKELEQLIKNQIIIIAKIGAKKKLELIKKANELNLKILNVKGGNKK